jgi:hypothetical protein
MAGHAGAAAATDGTNRQLEWYRESTKWLVAISGATIVLGMGWVIDGAFGVVGRALFTLAGACLLIASGCGILAVFKMNDYESSKSAADAARVARGASDRRAANRWFRLTFLLFFLGLASMVAAGLWLIWIEPGEPEADARFEVVAVAGEGGVAGVLIDREAEAMFLIKEDLASGVLSLVPQP